MNLSIFNFNKMIKAVLIFVVLFVGYNVYLFVAKPEVSMYQNQWQGNMVAAQEFIYNEKAPYVMVGSSMAARMKNEFLPKEFINLSFGGGSVLTGLEILKQSGFAPKMIYIENNVIFRNKDNKMIDTLFYPLWWRFKCFMPALQEKYQPLNILSSSIKGELGKTHEEHMKERRDEKIFQMSLVRHKENYNQKLSNYQNELKELKDLVKYFEDKSVEIIFFEVPIDESLAISTKAREQREVIKQNFVNKWLSLPANNQHKTTDGIHMTYKSAYGYSKEFIKEVKFD